MAVLAPAALRAQIADGGTTICIRIPRPRYSWVVVLFTIAWLGFWVVAGSQALGLTGEKEFLEGGKPFLVFWAVLMAYGAVMAAYQIGRLLLGTETIEVTPAAFRSRRSIGPVGWWREYALADVQRLRASEKGPPGTNLAIGLTPRILFDYGAKTVKLGHGVDWAEAHQLVEEICRSYPRLAAKSARD